MTGPATEPILLYDTTLRDGTQREGLVLSLADKLKIARRLDEAGFPYIEGGWPGSNPKDVDFFAAARSMTWQNARLAAFGSTRHRANAPAGDPNLQALVERRDARGDDLRQELAAARDRGPGRDAGREPGHGRRLRRLLPGGGREVVYDAEHSSTATSTTPPTPWPRCGPPSRGVPRRWRCATRTAAAYGRGPPDHGRGDRGLRRGAGPRRFGIHVHEDAGLSVANSLAAVQAGVTHVQGTINGYGERCGNANIVTIWADLALKMDLQTVPAGTDLVRLAELSAFVAEVANIVPNDHQPYVGVSAFAHKGGVHGAATARVRHAYQHIDPALVGNETRLVVSELGGRVNARWRAERLGHELDGVIDPRELSQLVKELESEGASFEGADASFELLIHRRRGDYLRAFRVRDYTVLIEQRDGGKTHAEASVKVEVGEEILHTAADGNGPVNALDQALRKALAAFYPGARPRAPGRLQGAHRGRRCHHGRSYAGADRVPGRGRNVVDDGRLRDQHHRGIGRCPDRLPRIRHLEVRRRAAAPRPARLHRSRFFVNLEERHDRTQSSPARQIRHGSSTCASHAGPATRAPRPRAGARWWSRAASIAGRPPRRATARWTRSSVPWTPPARRLRAAAPARLRRPCRRGRARLGGCGEVRLPARGREGERAERLVRRAWRRARTSSRRRCEAYVSALNQLLAEEQLGRRDG